MKILWVCNIVIPEFACEFGIKKNNYGGWITGVIDQLKNDSSYEIILCLPIIDESKRKDGKLGNIKYYSFPGIFTSFKESPEQYSRFLKILGMEKPDVIHIWGTEYLHSLSMVKACKALGMQNRILVNIQGLVYKYAECYSFGLPCELLNSTCYSRSILGDISDFKIKSEIEKEILKNVTHISGRTNWDFWCTELINPNLNYHYCGEILRKEFYDTITKWDVHTCNRHSIFISQATYSIKGFHTIISWLATLSKMYPDLKIRVAGSDPFSRKNDQYARYITDCIREYKLDEFVEFVGELDAKQMYNEYMSANVFLSPSLLENSSNSVCEAMMVGTPVVSTCVGGIPSIITHGISGFMYTLDELYMMPYYIDHIFKSDDVATEISKNGIAKVAKYNNKDDILNTVKGIYSLICEEGKE